MSRFYSYINSAEKIIKSFDGNITLVHHLKTFFAANKQMGGRDRKMIAKLCHSYFRCYYLINKKPIQECLLQALFLCAQDKDPLLEEMAPELNEKLPMAVAEKLAFLNYQVENIFPFLSRLSPEINSYLFSLSLLVQPDLFVRARPGKEKTVTDKLTTAGIDFSREQDCFRLPNSSALKEIITLNEDAVIQDYNSQKVLDYLDKYKPVSSIPDVWDCCAASGGKSILLADKFHNNFHLTVSDIRSTILDNLQKRLREAGVQVVKQFITDLTKEPATENQFDMVVADVPCTGSGTWARTPDQMAFFNKKTAEQYVAKQLKIAANVFASLKAGGLFFYITCSVFNIENEGVIESLAKQFSFDILQMHYLHGYDKKADSLFVAVLKKTH